MEQQLRINPYTLPEGQHGWRGLSLPGNCKRKWYTILHNDKVLVTALLLIPGERSIRHSHESGELSIHYSGELNPRVTWNPPGFVHGGPPVSPNVPFQGQDNIAIDEASRRSSLPEVARLIEQISELRLEVQSLQQALQELRRPEPAPRVIVDILFPPFKTTIDDPAYPEKKTVVGQWFD